MPLIDPGPDPTFAEIEAGIAANKAERAIVDADRAAALAAAAAARSDLRQADRAERIVDNNLRAWLRAIRNKAGAGG